MDNLYLNIFQTKKANKLFAFFYFNFFNHMVIWYKLKNIESNNQIINMKIEVKRKTTNKPFMTSLNFGKYIFLNSFFTSEKNNQNDLPCDENENKPIDIIKINIIATKE